MSNEFNDAILKMATNRTAIEAKSLRCPIFFTPKKASRKSGTALNALAAKSGKANAGTLNVSNASKREVFTLLFLCW